MKITKEEDYAVNLIHALSTWRGKTFISLSEVASRYRLSKFFLKKAAMKLMEAGLLISKEGSHGGYLLAKPTGKISYGQVITAISGEIDISPCCHTCLRKICHSRQTWININAKIKNLLNSLPITNY